MLPLKEHTHLRPPFKTIEEVHEAIGGFWDATTLQKVADCPRKFFYRVKRNLEPQGPPSLPLVVGIAIHTCLEYYYSLPAHTRQTLEAQIASINLALATYSSFDPDIPNAPTKHQHLTPEHVEEVMKHYFHYWNHQAIDIYEPIQVSLDDLDLNSLVAGRFLINNEGNVLLGESSLVMEFDVDGEPFYLAGKPDLPVRDQLGRIYAMDHKSTSGNLGDWHKKNFETSNQLRGYMGMLRNLLGITPSDAVINALYVGKYPTSITSSTRTFFDRYTFDFTEEHIDEAIRNQKAWKDSIDYFEESGYWPQGCGYGGCDMPNLCCAGPADREHKIIEEYKQSSRSFWDL